MAGNMISFLWVASEASVYMKDTAHEIAPSFTDSDINQLIAGECLDESPFSRHYNQVEEFFLKLEKEFLVPHLPIHHDVRNPRPDADYLESIKNVVGQIVAMVPSVFSDLTYFFDPREILKPCFFRLYKIEDSHYLYLLKLDLVYRSQDDTITEKGTNDITPEYSSHHLFLEPTLIPLDKIDVQDGKVRSMRVRQTISQTWIGERGRGYLAQGIWVDDDLTKFFSKLFLPKGRRMYPFYPFSCRYRTVCQTVIDFGLQKIKKDTSSFAQNAAIHRASHGQDRGRCEEQQILRRVGDLRPVTREDPRILAQSL